jgi:hypothetical protein
LLASTETWQDLVWASLPPEDPPIAEPTDEHLYTAALARIFYVASEGVAARAYPLIVIEGTVDSRQIADRTFAHFGELSVSLFIERDTEDDVTEQSADLLDEVLAPLRDDVLDLQGTNDPESNESHIVLQTFNWDYQSIGPVQEDDKIWYAAARSDWGVTT